MPAGTRTFGGLDETFIEPKVLPPPPTRHALLAFLVALAAILHIGTVGWSDIQNGAEGYYASQARALSESETVVSPDPPLTSWLLIASYKCFDVTATAARLPIAAAVIASVALTFLIGEKLGGYWRGFVAGLIHLCSLGSFIWARMVTPEPIFAAFLGAAVFCMVCGYQRQRTRRFWFAGVWLSAAFMCLTKGVVGLLFLAAILGILAIIFREARVRFRLLLQWPGILIFLAVAGLGFWLNRFHGILYASRIAEGVPLFRFAGAHLIWWFPAVLLVLPGICLGWRKVFRPHEFEFADALPLCWIAIGLGPLLCHPQRQDFDSLSMWSAFALFAAAAWERMPSSLRMAGLCLTASVGLALAGAAALNVTASLPGLPSAWLSVRWVLLLAGFSIVFFSAAAAHFSWRNRETVAIAILLLGMVPIGLSIAEGLNRFGSYLSLADAARFLEPRIDETGEVLFEGSSASGSSLGFYLDRPPLFLPPAAEPEPVFERLRATHPVYLIIAKERIPFWQERLTAEFHIYHQETTCGGHVVVSNQP